MLLGYRHHGIEHYFDGSVFLSFFLSFFLSVSLIHTSTTHLQHSHNEDKKKMVENPSSLVKFMYCCRGCFCEGLFCRIIDLSNQSIYLSISSHLIASHISIYYIRLSSGCSDPLNDHSSAAYIEACKNYVSCCIEIGGDFNHRKYSMAIAAHTSNNK